MGDELLKDNPERWVLLPVKYDDIFAHYKIIEEAFWTPDDANLLKDTDSANKLPQALRDAINDLAAYNALSYLRIFDVCAASRDMLVEIQSPEARAYYGFQIAYEQFHIEAHNMLLEIIMPVQEAREELCRKINGAPTVQAKKRWYEAHVDDKSKSFVSRVFALAIVKKIFNSANVLMTSWLKKNSAELSGWVESHSLVIDDLGRHVDFCSCLFNRMVGKPSSEELTAMVQTAVDCEVSFLEAMIPTDQLGVAKDQLRPFVEWIADEMLQVMKVPTLFNRQKPVSFVVTKFKTAVKQDGRVSAKEQLDVMERWREAQSGKAAASQQVFSLNEDF